MNGFAMNRITAELNRMIMAPPSYCSAPIITNDNLLNWIIVLNGPDESVYANGKFKLSINFCDGYPFKPPTIKFLSKIYHCNIDCKGNICLDILKDQWSAAWSIETVLLALVSLLSECNPKDPLVYSIGREYVLDRKAHDRKARVWTKKYAN